MNQFNKVFSLTVEQVPVFQIHTLISILIRTMLNILLEIYIILECYIKLSSISLFAQTGNFTKRLSFVCSV